MITDRIHIPYAAAAKLRRDKSSFLALSLSAAIKMLHGSSVLTLPTESKVRRLFHCGAAKAKKALKAAHAHPELFSTDSKGSLVARDLFRMAGIEGRHKRKQGPLPNKKGSDETAVGCVRVECGTEISLSSIERQLRRGLLLCAIEAKQRLDGNYGAKLAAEPDRARRRRGLGVRKAGRIAGVSKSSAHKMLRELAQSHRMEIRRTRITLVRDLDHGEWMVPCPGMYAHRRLFVMCVSGTAYQCCREAYGYVLPDLKPEGLSLVRPFSHRRRGGDCKASLGKEEPKGFYDRNPQFC